MFPIALNMESLPILLTGDAPFLTGRMNYLKQANASNVTIVCNNACHCLREIAGDHLHERDVTLDDVKAAKVVMVAGLDREGSERMHGWAKQEGKLINVEDVMDLCDFYFTANLRRGKMVVSVSTSGASPTVARKMRDHIGHMYGPEWEQRLDEIGEMRLKLRAEGKGMKEVIAITEAYLKEQGWLQPDGDDEAAA